MKQQAAMPQPPQLAVVRSPSDRRQSVHAEPWSKITIMMEDHHVTYLDLVSMFMRVRHHRTVARAEIVRAFVEFMERSEIDFTQFATIEDMTAYMTEYFGQIPDRGRLPLLESGLFHRRHFEQEHGGRAIDVPKQRKQPMGAVAHSR